MDRFVKRTCTSSDPHNFERFVARQREDHARALRELTAGQKAGCWSWWIFPTPPFLKNGVPVGSGTNRLYELKNDAEGLAYLAYGQLRDNYLAIVDAMNQSLADGVEPHRLLGIDVPRAEASAKYFSHLAELGDGDEELGAACQRALALLRPSTGEAARCSAPAKAVAAQSGPLSSHKRALPVEREATHHKDARHEEQDETPPPEDCRSMAAVPSDAESEPEPLPAEPEVAK